jgi:predicted GNAT family N-acyltransferase
MEVKQIESKDTIELRHKVLRANYDVSTCHYEGDDSEGTFHLGAFIDDKLASIASFYLDNHPKIDETYQFRLRGMATLKEYQGQGLSSALLKTAFPLIKQNHIKTLWCNARTSATGFYKKVGFEVVSDEFEVPDIGPHFVMIKDIE